LLPDHRPCFDEIFTKNRKSLENWIVPPGTYGIYIKEYPRVPHQTIIVAAVETPTVTTPPPTPTETETAAPTVSVAQTPQITKPGFNPWYILLAFIVVAGLVVFIYYLTYRKV